jgi:hypothetical protein
MMKTCKDVTFGLFLILFMAFGIGGQGVARSLLEQTADNVRPKKDDIQG